MSLATAKPICRYGQKCYRKNVEHLQRFSHPWNGDADSSARLEEKQLKADVQLSSTTSRATSPGAKRRKVASDDMIELGKNKPVVSDDKKENGSVGCTVSVGGLKSLSERKQFIKQHFLVEMPADFYRFWELCKELNSKNPLDALEVVDLQLVGPFEVLAGKFDHVKSISPSALLCHWRYYYDLPEFQTVIKGDDRSLFHIGYYRDEPGQADAPIVCTNCAAADGTMKIVGDNLFAAVDQILSSAQVDERKSERIGRLRIGLQKCAAAHKFSLAVNSERVRQRKRIVVAACFHSAGIVVPFKDNVGYRPIPESNANLRRMLDRIAEVDSDEKLLAKRMESLQEIITLIQFANDECDYGMGLEFGHDLFVSGHQVLHPHIMRLLSVAYMLLNRDAFSQILDAHLSNRKQGSDLSAI